MEFPPVETFYPATIKDVEAAPTDRIAELIRGRLYISRMPPPIPCYTRSVLASELWGPFDRGGVDPGGWWIHNLPEFYLGEDVLVPDIAGVRRERVPTLPEIRFPVPPDWACEILSPSTESIDRAEKMPVYAREGVKHVWLVNPILKFLEVFELHTNGWLRIGCYAGDARVRAVPFDAIELDLHLLWA